MLHGWPGSVREFYEIIPILTTPQKGTYNLLKLLRFAYSREFKNR